MFPLTTVWIYSLDETYPRENLESEHYRLFGHQPELYTDELSREKTVSWSLSVYYDNLFEMHGIVKVCAGCVAVIVVVQENPGHTFGTRCTFLSKIFGTSIYLTKHRVK
jgi:hypothetical protein